MQKNVRSRAANSILIGSLLLPLSFALAEVSTSSAATTTSSTTNPYLSPAAVEARVREYFSDSTVMQNIAKCESGFRQFNQDGTPLDGGSGGMIGVFQIGKAVHEEFANSIGLDINTLEGNIGYARYLYAKDGTDPWLSSFNCWKTASSVEASSDVSTSSSAAMVFASDLSLGTVSQEVQSLQIILNHLGYTIADSGPGSAGNETTKYGLLTRDAVRRFQCAQKIACDGDEYTTGYGYVGKRTRTALLSFANGKIGTSSGTSSTPTVSTSSKDAEIAALKARIANVAKELADLQAELQAKTGQ